MQRGPVSTTTVPHDRLSLLPKELLDTIYSLVFYSKNGPSTIRIKGQLPPPSSPWHADDRRSLQSILALPLDHRYKDRRRTRRLKDLWPDNVEEAFFRGLDWGYRYKCYNLNELVSEIVYELTGIRWDRQQISSHIQLLKNWIYDMEPASKHRLGAILDSGRKLQRLSTLNDIERIVEIIGNMQGELPKLLSAFKEEHRAGVLVPPKPMKDLSSSPIITPNSDVFRLLSSIASIPNAAPYLSLNPINIDPIDLSLTLVNRFHRTHTLAILTSTLIYDFGDEIRSIYTLQRPFTSGFIKRIRLTFIEEYMRSSFLDILASGKISALPNLRKLFIELWPRNPAREDRQDRTWGDQTLCILEALRGVNATVVLELRWKIDCERFEEQYVGEQGWKIRSEREGERWEAQEGMCWRSYELKARNGGLHAPRLLRDFTGLRI